jgi:S1-C subfamily serine protease
VLAGEEVPISSGHHAEARFESGSWWIVDLGSTNGTQVNGSPIVSRRLRAGDRIAFGGAPLLLCVRSWRGAAPVLAGILLLLTAAALLWKMRELAAGFEPVAESASASVYLIALEQAGERRQIATAFAVRADGVLATNAHVVLELRRRGALPPGGPMRGIAVGSDSTGRGRPLHGARIHPQYQEGRLSQDVALLYLAPGPPLAPLPLATAAELAGLRRGVRLATLGFPQGSTDAWRPRARLSEDILGDIRGARYLGVGLNIAPGTSGSPILIHSGRVIGLVAGGDFGRDPAHPDRLAPASGMNWGLTVGALRELLAGSEHRPR